MIAAPDIRDLRQWLITPTMIVEVFSRRTIIEMQEDPVGQLTLRDHKSGIDDFGLDRGSVGTTMFGQRERLAGEQQLEIEWKKKCNLEFKAANHTYQRQDYDFPTEFVQSLFVE